MADLLRDFVVMRFEREVAGIQQVDFRLRQIVPIGSRTGVNEGGIIPAHTASSGG